MLMRLPQVKNGANEMPSLEPQNIDRHNWYYEYPTYLLLVHEVKDNGAHIRTDNIKIHWRRLKQSMERSYKPRKRKRGSKD